MNLIWEWAKENLDLDEMTRAKFEELAHEEWRKRLFNCFRYLQIPAIMLRLFDLDENSGGVTFEEFPCLSESCERFMAALEKNQLIIIDERNDVIRINYGELLRLVGRKEHG